MSVLLERVAELLIEDGYVCAPSVEASDEIRFENPSVFGFVIEFETIESLLASWRDRQGSFLREYSRQIQLLPEKAWNAYAVLLTAEAGNRAEQSSLAALEEDFHATRKIVRDGISSREGTRRALSPLLTLRYAPVLRPVDVLERLRGSIPDTIHTALVRGDSAQTIVRQITIPE